MALDSFFQRFGGNPALIQALIPLILQARQQHRQQSVPVGNGPDQVPVLFGGRPAPVARSGVQSDDGLDPYTIPPAPVPQGRAPALGGGYVGPRFPGAAGPLGGFAGAFPPARRPPVFGRAQGMGVYRDARGNLNYKTTGPPRFRRGY